MRRDLLKSIALCLLLLGLMPFTRGRGQEKKDPRAWGGNHVGQPIPEYVEGSGCLFCHRNDIGPLWAKDSHALTVRYREAAPEMEALLKSQPALSKPAPEVEFFLGSRHVGRFLRKDGYGKFAMLAAQVHLTPEKKAESWIGLENLAWDRETFANRCAGCHATAVDPSNNAFSAFSLDCYTCHGHVDLEHTKDKALVWLSKKRRSDAQAITSLCAQCHLRGGKSRSTGLPYPNNFIAGDNLFQDFEVDFARADDPALNAGDRHIWRNVRDVAVNGIETITCLSCHQLHGNGSFKHRRILRAPICSECHASEGSFKEVKKYTVRSEVCGY